MIAGISVFSVQNYEQKEANPSRIIGGASCPPAELVRHEGPVCDRTMYSLKKLTDQRMLINAQLYRPEL